MAAVSHLEALLAKMPSSLDSLGGGDDGILVYISMWRSACIGRAPPRRLRVQRQLKAFFLQKGSLDSSCVPCVVNQAVMCPKQGLYMKWT